MKNNQTNLRLGPSFEYPIKLIYEKKYLPLVILDKSYTIGSWIQIGDADLVKIMAASGFNFLVRNKLA